MGQVTALQVTPPRVVLSYLDHLSIYCGIVAFTETVCLGTKARHSLVADLLLQDVAELSAPIPEESSGWIWPLSLLCAVWSLLLALLCISYNRLLEKVHKHLRHSFLPSYVLI